MSQRSFFDEDSNLAPDETFRDWAEQEFLPLARIVFPNGIEGTYDYRIPEPLEGKLFAGMRVMVPLGKSNRSTLGYCIGESFKTLPRDQIGRFKFVHSTVDSERLLSDNMLKVADWISEYYLCPLGTVLEAMLPAGVRGRAATRLTPVLSVCEDFERKIEQVRNLSMQPQKSGGESGEKSEVRESGSDSKAFSFQLSPQSQRPRPGTVRSIQSLRPGNAGEPSPPQKPAKNSGILTKKQLYILEVLQKSPEPLSVSELCKAAKCSQGPIQLLKKLGLIRTKTIRRNTVPKLKIETPILPEDQKKHRLNEQQRSAFEQIVQSFRKIEHETFLLHGITGSGKTEVYIQIIEEVVRCGKQAIVLVPEISLTPQTVGRFKGRFEHVAVLHSHLTDAERSRQWNRIARGEVQVVVGARSAVFAPAPHLGVIIIDEEHESSFKQDIAPRYHTRDVAKKRAELESVPLVLGSATPSLESWNEAQCGRFRLLSMSHRVKGLALPAVRIVDLREAARSRATKGAIHQQLHGAIYDAIEKKEQVILLLNRRGFSTHIQCSACGETVKCPDCDVSLTHHRTEEIALCHYCDHQVPAPAKCPECGFLGIRYSGFGTQKLEQEIKSRFPRTSVLRMDTDTMQGHGAHERALARFRSGEVQILLGTQMIAKGLDFPNVTLVGVINADTALHLPDFRASERTFLLITQVAGRTGRGEKGGRVIVQTFNPDHSAILSAAQHDYRRFVEKELPLRKVLEYPPFTKLARFVFRGTHEIATREFAEYFAQKLRGELEQGRLFQESTQPLYFRLLGPAPAPFAKLRGFFRFHLHLHVYDSAFLRWAFHRVKKNLKTPENIQWIIDIDPMDMQ